MNEKLKSKIQNRKCRQSGFTLLEMLTVLGILGMLMATAFTGLAQAQRQARVAKANADIRALVNAWFAYEAANDDWPGDLPPNGDPTPALADANFMQVLLGKGKDGGKVYLNATMRGTPPAFRDPWGTPYYVKITSQDKVPEISDTFMAAITFPNRNRPPAPPPR